MCSAALLLGCRDSGCVVSAQWLSAASRLLLLRPLPLPSICCHDGAVLLLLLLLRIWGGDSTCRGLGVKLTSLAAGCRSSGCVNTVRPVIAGLFRNAAAATSEVACCLDAEMILSSGLCSRVCTRIPDLVAAGVQSSRKDKAGMLAPTVSCEPASQSTATACYSVSVVEDSRLHNYMYFLTFTDVRAYVNCLAALQASHVRHVPAVCCCM